MEDTLNSLSIERVEEPISINEIIPPYKYKVQDGNVSEEFSEDLYKGLLEFISTNEGLLSQDIFKDRESYTMGCKSMLAIVRLWIDVTSIEKVEETKENNNLEV